MILDGVVTFSTQLADKQSFLQLFLGDGQKYLVFRQDKT
jgi:hypothetical protein